MVNNGFLSFSVKKVVHLPGVIVFYGEALALTNWNIAVIIN